MSQSNRLIGRLRSVGILTLSVTAIFTGITAYENRDRLFHTFVMPAVHLLPAETTYNLAVLACKYRIYPASNYMDDLNLHTSFFGRTISNPIGIAAGFDKNGEAVRGLKDLGFGFIEIGSVTPIAQKGFHNPRVLRLNDDRAMINYHGFDSEGHQVVAQRLRKLRTQDNFGAIVGVNLGSNRDSRAPISDYVLGVKTFGPVADYVVINFNSVSRKGQRSKQNKLKLIELLVAVKRARDDLKQKRRVPILLKLSPDMTLTDMKDIVSVINMRGCHVDGLIVSNTIVEQENLSDSIIDSRIGVLSGQRLRDHSTKLIAQMYKLTKGNVTIVGVGGVSSGQDAFEKIEAGASYVQIYSALVHEGPDLVERIKEDLSKQLHKLGFANIEDAVGSNFKKYLPAK